MAHAYVDTTKQGRERYSGPMTYGKLGEAAIDLAWARTKEPDGEDAGSFDLWWLDALDQPWWAPWMEQYRQEAREIYESALKAMRAETTEQQPDALTRLEAHMPNLAFRHNEDRIVVAHCISKARMEMEMLRTSRAIADDARPDMGERLTLADKRLEAAQATCNTLSAKASESLRMGQQQGRVELAQAVLGVIGDGYTANGVAEWLRSIADEDAGQ